MTHALLIVDVQNDFCEGGALAVEGGAAVARGITEMDLLGRYDLVIASQDWHNPLPDLNGGHFALEGTDPDYANTWPVHCVAGSMGAEIHPNLTLPAGTVRLKKGQGRPDYSALQGIGSNGETIRRVANEFGIYTLDVVGIATDHCVYRSTIDALALGIQNVRVLVDRCAGVSTATTAAALDDMQRNGAVLVTGE